MTFCSFRSKATARQTRIFPRPPAIMNMMTNRKLQSYAAGEVVCVDCPIRRVIISVLCVVLLVAAVVTFPKRNADEFSCSRLVLVVS